jgi:hypothetical protein
MELDLLGCVVASLLASCQLFSLICISAASNVCHLAYATTKQADHLKESTAVVLQGTTGRTPGRNW